MQKRGQICFLLTRMELYVIWFHAKDIESGWRKIHMRTAYDMESQEFLSWHVMTFIAFCLDDERGDRRFEVWNRALG